MSYFARRLNNESLVQDALAPHIRDHVDVCNSVLDLGSAMVVEEPQLGERTSASLVVACLLARLLDDLRVCVLEAERGYVLQAHALGANLLEAACAAAFIANDQDRAQEWLRHVDQSVTYPPFTPALKAAVAFIAGDAVQKGQFGRQYEESCMAKHSNPRALRSLGLEMKDDTIHLWWGPHMSDAVVKVTRRALAQAAQSAIIASGVFIKIPRVSGR